MLIAPSQFYEAAGGEAGGDGDEGEGASEAEGAPAGANGKGGFRGSDPSRDDISSNLSIPWHTMAASLTLGHISGFSIFASLRVKFAGSAFVT